MCGVQLFNDIYITNIDPWLVTRENDTCLVEMVSYFNLTPLNARMFILSITEVLEKVGNVAKNGKGFPNLVYVAFLSVVVVVRDIHANHPLIEHVGEQQIPKAAACNPG